ncbi:polysaccharide pyruvyl transferase family protein [Planctomycetota bacterium]
MRILVENGCYDLRNMGDVAMLQVAVSRLMQLWPDALIEVITDSPALLARYCPGSHPVPAAGRYLWCRDRNLFRVVGLSGAGGVGKLSLKLWNHIRRRRPELAKALIGINARCRKVDVSQMDVFLKSLCDCDLLVVSGGGNITDTFLNYAFTLLDVLEMSIRRGKPTVMFSHGIGPIRNEKLYAKAKLVLGKLDIIAVREKRVSPAILESLGIDRERIVVTGDDAIALAYQKRKAQFGDRIGVNLRVAEYSQIKKEDIEILRLVLHRSARKYNAELTALPICFQKENSDVKVIAKLLADYDKGSVGGQGLDSPQELIAGVGSCRVVVTGSYHPAVFALAQGIPVVALVNSDYYKDKFLGLSSQFGCGCDVVFLSGPDASEKLAASIERAWGLAEQIRPELLKSAQRQIAASISVYQRLYDMVESGTVTTKPVTKERYKVDVYDYKYTNI